MGRFFVIPKIFRIFATVFTPEVEAQAEAEGWDAIYKKALSYALFLTLENLAVHKQLSNSKATMTLMGVYMSNIHISVGFGVARFDN